LQHTLLAPFESAIGLVTIWKNKIMIKNTRCMMIEMN
jgi:hypothetical protein